MFLHGSDLLQGEPEGIDHEQAFGYVHLVQLVVLECKYEENKENEEAVLALSKASESTRVCH